MSLNSPPNLPKSILRSVLEDMGMLDDAETNDNLTDYNTLEYEMRDLNYEFKLLCQRNHDGSFATRAERGRTLALVANQLPELGFRNLTIHGLKPKHVEALIDRWKAEGLSIGTIKNRVSHIRWWAQKVNKASVVARSNDAYGIGERRFVDNVSKAWSLQAERVEKISDSNVRFALYLQAAFGFRCAESIKFNVSYADQGDYLVLKASWCKGGKERTVPILTAEQRALLDRVRVHAHKGSLIPAAMTYKHQLQRFKYECGRVGIHGVHGLRHAYAQRRYEQLAGWKCPAQGGPTSRQLSAEQKGIDREARLIISRELGHEREQVTAIYLGR